MLKIIKGLVIFFVLILNSCNSQKDYYVSTTGNDSNIGTKEDPFLTIERARDQVRFFKKKHSNNGVNVFIREGVYSLDKSIEFNASDSGTEQNPIVYSAFNNEVVSIQGGVNLPVSSLKSVEDKKIYALLDEKSRDKIKTIDLKKLNITDYGTLKPQGFRRPYQPMCLELFVNNQPMILSRWPNKKNILIDEVLEKGSVPRYGDFLDKGGVFTYKTEAKKDWKITDDLWISGFFNFGYADDAVRVKTIDTEKKLITTYQATMYGFAAGLEFRAFYFYNLLDELDLPGEYFMDRKQGKLYFMPPSDTKIHKIQISILEEPMLVFEEAAFIEFQNITFENTRGIGVYIEGGESIKINSCILRNIGEVAVSIGKGVEPFKDLKHAGTGIPTSRIIGSWHEHLYDNSAFNRNGGKNHGIENCEIYNIGSGAISLGGGNRKTLIPANNYVKNCKISNFNRIGKSYRAGVNVDGVGNIVEHCEIFNSSGSAIYLHGNDHLIQYNNLHDNLKEADDMGVIYIGRDPSEYGNVIQYNYFHHNGNTTGGMHGTNAIHLDDISCGVTIHGNIFYKNDHLICLNGGYNNKITNNIFLDNRVSLDSHRGILTGWNPEEWKSYVHKDFMQKRLFEAVDISIEPYISKYPELIELYSKPIGDKQRNLVKNNICINSGTLKIPVWRESHSHWNKNRNNLISNYESLDNVMAIDSISFEIKDLTILESLDGFENIPLAKMGLLKHK